MNNVVNEYFEWMYSMVCDPKQISSVRYRKLLTRLHDTEFFWQMERDINRAKDGINLRNRFSDETGYDVDEIMEMPCSVFEMMIALCLRCEETIMDNPDKGNRMSQWFWEMIVNLGLGGQHDENYDDDYIDSCLYIFMNREYEPDGKGGLVRLNNHRQDLRNVEIWYQMMWYLEEIIEEE